MALRRGRTRSSSAQSTPPLRLPLNAGSLSQPALRIVQPSPEVSRSRSVQTRQPSTQPCPAIRMSDLEEHEILSCPVCAINVTDDTNALLCDQCHIWYHSQCLFISDEEYNSLSVSPDKWYCDHCRSIRANKVRWGSLEGEAEISAAMKSAYFMEKEDVFTPTGKKWH